MKDFVKSLFCESSGSRLSKSTKLRMEALESRQLLDAAGLAAIVNAEDAVAETVVVAEPTAVEPIDISQIDDGSMEEYTLSVSTNDPHVGVRVTATLTPSAEATYQWYADGEAIANAMSTYYYPTAKLTGKTLSVTASIVDGPEVSAEVGVISQTLSKVTIANTIPVVGVGLTTYTTPVTQSVSAQWYRVSDGEATAIDGATSLNYVPTADDVGCYLKIVVEGENGYQGTVEKTTSVAVLATSPLTISPEDAKVGVPLDAILTPADPNATYQWYRLTDEGWEWIDDATDSSFTPTKDNLGETLRVAATYAEGEYAGLRAFAVASVVAPTIELSTYEPTWGHRVSASLDPVDTFATYQWYSGSDEVGWTAISGAKYSYFSPDIRYIGKSLKVEATYKRGEAVGFTVSDQTGPVKFDLLGVSIKEDGLLAVGSSVSASVKERYATAEYQWYRIDAAGVETEIEGAVDTSYTAVLADAGCYLKVVATGVGDSTGVYEAVSSQPVVFNPVTLSTNDPSLGIRVRANVSVDPAYARFSWAYGSDESGWTDVQKTHVDYYTPSYPQVGSQLKVIVSYVSGELAGQTFEAITENIVTRPVEGVVLRVHSEVVGSTLSVYTKPVGATVEYQWYRVDAEGQDILIDGATNSRYSPTVEDVGSKLKLVVSGVGSYVGSAEVTTEVVRGRSTGNTVDEIDEDVFEVIAQSLL